MTDSFLVAVNAVIPFMIYLAIGAIVVRVGAADREFMARLNKMAFHVLFPFMMFNNVYSASRDNMPSLKLVLFSVGLILALIGVLQLVVPRLVKENARRGVLIQAVFRSNYALYGIPLMGSVYGSAGSALASVMAPILVSLFNIAAVIVLEYYRSGKSAGLRTLLLKMVQNPLLQGCVLGIIFFLFRISLPTCLATPVAALGNMATPLSLMTLGASLQFSAVKKNTRYLAPTLLVRLVLLPLVMLVICYLAGLRNMELFLILVIFGTPVAAASYPMAANMGGDGELAGQLVFLSTLFSLGTMFLFVFTYASLGML